MAGLGDGRGYSDHRGGAGGGRRLHSDNMDDIQSPNKRQIREAAIQSEKESFLKMPLDEKRKLYKCRHNYETLDKIQTQSEYFQEHRKKLLKKVRDTQPKFYVDEKLNEKISLWRGDITTLEIDVIVNAANSSLLGGGGVDGCIHRAAGSQLVKECELLHGCDTGDCKITCGYNLPAKYVLHTVGPIGQNHAMLKSCYKKCLDQMKKNDLRTIAFPCISTGIYGYPNDDACQVALNTVRQWLEVKDNASQVDRIIFCLFLKIDIDLYETYMSVYFPLESTKSDGDSAAEDNAGHRKSTYKSKGCDKTEPGDSSNVGNSKKGSKSTGEKSTEDDKSAKAKKDGNAKKDSKSAEDDKLAKDDKTKKDGKSTEYDKLAKDGKQKKDDKSTEDDKSAKDGKQKKDGKSAKDGKQKKDDKSTEDDKFAKDGKQKKDNKPTEDDKSAKDCKQKKSNKSTEDDKLAKDGKTKKDGKSTEGDKSATADQTDVGEMSMDVDASTQPDDSMEDVDLQKQATGVGHDAGEEQAMECSQEQPMECSQEDKPAMQETSANKEAPKNPATSPK